MIVLRRWTKRRRRVSAELTVALAACLGCAPQGEDATSAAGSSGSGSMGTSGAATGPTPTATGNASTADTSTGAVPPDEIWSGVVSLRQYPDGEDPVAQFEVTGELRGTRMEVFGNSPSAAFEFSIDPANTAAHIHVNTENPPELTYAVTFPDGPVFTEAEAAQSDWSVGPNGYSGHGAILDARYGFTFFLGSDEPVTYGCITPNDPSPNCLERWSPRYAFDPDDGTRMCQCPSCSVAEGPCDRSAAVGECIFDRFEGEEYIRVLYAWDCEAVELVGGMLADRCFVDHSVPDGDFNELNGGCRGL